MEAKHVGNNIGGRSKEYQRHYFHGEIRERKIGVHDCWVSRILRFADLRDHTDRCSIS